jgi:hypothetical protein
LTESTAINIVRAIFLLAISLTCTRWYFAATEWNLVAILAAGLLALTTALVCYLMARNCINDSSTIRDEIAYRVLLACALIGIINAFLPVARAVITR